MLNRYKNFKICIFCQILHFVLKKYHNFESCQNMLILKTFSFLYHKLQLWFICHLHYTLFTCGKGILKFCLFWGKNTIKGTTQVSGHSLKLQFCMFEISLGKCIIVWTVIKKIGIFLLIAKFICSKLNTHQKKIACSKHSNLQNG